MYTFLSNTEQDTINFANTIAPVLKKGDIIVLTGNLGSGKTKFTQGILSYFGLEAEISSPTFTIVNEYEIPNNIIYHFDVYRLNSVDEFYAIGGEEYFDNGICIVEWGEMILDALPPTYTQIQFERNLENPNTRFLKIENIGNVNIELVQTLKKICKIES